MRLSKKELTAMVAMAVAMAGADGKVEENEVMAIVADLSGFGKDGDEIAEIVDDARNMDATDALSIVAKLGDEEKEYVTAFLAVVMAADGDIDDEELKLWRLITNVCNLPAMSVKEGVELWKQYNS